MKKIIFFLLLSSILIAQNTNSFVDAIKSINTLKVREFLKNGADPNTPVDGEPAICFIARLSGVNSNSVFDELIQFGANPNSISKEGYSLVSLCMSKFNVDQTKELIKRGADLNYKNKGSMPPPLIMAVTGKRNWPKSNIYPELIKLMIENKADVNMQDSQGITALMTAVWGKDLESAKYLLECGAYPNIKNFNSETPLYAAVSSKYTEIAGLLLDSGADPNIAQLGKETPLMEAAKSGNKELVTMLLAKGAKTNLKNKWNETAQYLAQQNGHKEIVEILKKSGTKNK